MAPRYPGRKPTVQLLDQLNLREELLNALVVAPLARLIGPIVGRDPSTFDTIEEIEGLFDEFFGGLGIDIDFDALKEALEGTYSGSDPALLAIKSIAVGFRSVLGGVPALNLSQLSTAPQDLIGGAGDFTLVESIEAAEGWSHDATVGVGSPLGAARFDATGDPGILFPPIGARAGVVPGEKYFPEAQVRWQGLPSGEQLQMVVRWYQDAAVLSDTRVSLVTTPPAAGGFMLVQGEVTAPAGATHGLPGVEVSAISSGTVWWDRVRLMAKRESLPQAVIAGLTDALESLGDWIEALVDQLLSALGVPALGTLWDKITDLSDEVGDWLGDTQDQAAALLDLIGDLWSNPGDILGSLPISKITNLVSELGGKASASVVSTLQTTLNQFEDVFNGLVVTPVNSIVSALKSWYDSIFGGGSSSYIPLGQKGANNGVAPLNGSGKLATSFLITDTASNPPTLDGGGKIKSAQLPDFSSSYLAVGTRGAAGGVAPLNGSAVVPLANLPEEVGGLGGSGFGLPYIELVLSADLSMTGSDPQVFPASSDWIQTGTTSPSWGTYGPGYPGFRVPTPGIWSVSVSCALAGGANDGAVSLLRQATGQATGALMMIRRIPGQATTTLNMTTHSVGQFGLTEDNYITPYFTRSGSGNRTLTGANPQGEMTRVVCVYLGAA